MAHSVFALPARLSAKADPRLIEDDEAHFAEVARWLAHSRTDLSERLAVERRISARSGPEAWDRDQQVHRLATRLRSLSRYGLDLCLGHMVTDEGGTVYIGRLGLTDGTGRRLLVDWRSPTAEPFFAATAARPLGLLRRRRYRWTGGRITDYWDESFGAVDTDSRAALDDESAFLASLGDSRTERMRDVLGTIAAEQDAAIRAPSRGALVVDGGPGTGKTVVALHRAAYLLYSDPRLRHHRGQVLFIGPHHPYLAYVADVLPSLGEDGVQTCTIRDLLPEGANAPAESDPDIARLKASAALVGAIEPAVRFYEEPPTEELELPTPWADLWLDAQDWALAFEAPEPGTPHNEARAAILDALVETAVDRYDGDVPPDTVRAWLRGHRPLVSALHRVWPLVEATDLLGDLWSVPAYLRRCAPWLPRTEIAALQRSDPQAWTLSDLPLLDAARQRLGDPAADHRAQTRRAVLADQHDQLERVVADLLAADDDGEAAVIMLRGEDLRDALADESAVATIDPDLLAGPFAHVVVDEAQELTDAEWQMLLSRCPARSFTIVGDRAQARRGFAESWSDRLQRVGIGSAEVLSLSINYRTPIEVMAEAEPVIRAVIPDANVPRSIRSSGRPVRRGRRAQRDHVLDEWLAEHDDGIACVIGDREFSEAPRVRSLTPELAKGLEFDLVVLTDPDAFGQGVAGGVDRYVATTRTTGELVILT